MNHAETAAFLLMMREYYPRDLTASTVETKVTAWEIVLNDLPFQTAQAALIAFVANDTRGFPPVPGQILDAARKLMDKGDGMSEMEAWALVRKAVSNSGYAAAQEFERLPPMIRSIVHSPNQLRQWGMMDESVFNSVVQSNFLRSYRAKRDSWEAWMMVPSGIRAIAGRVASGMSLPEIEEPAQLEEQNKKRAAMKLLLESYGHNSRNGGKT